MNNQKTVKSANSEKSAVLYIVTCALVVIQPLLDILSSIVINLGKANYISVSGAVRAVIIAAVTVFTLGFYKGGGIFEGGGLDDGDLAGLAIAGRITALHTDGITVHCNILLYWVCPNSTIPRRSTCLRRGIETLNFSCRGVLHCV